MLSLSVYSNHFTHLQRAVHKLYSMFTISQSFCNSQSSHTCKPGDTWMFPFFFSLHCYSLFSFVVVRASSHAHAHLYTSTQPNFLVTAIKLVRVAFSFFFFFSSRRWRHSSIKYNFPKVLQIPNHSHFSHRIYSHFLLSALPWNLLIDFPCDCIFR